MTRCGGRTLGAGAFFSAAGLASFFASLTGPEGPLGCEKSPFSTPVFRALLNSESNWVSDVVVIVLLALTYFLMD